MRRDIKLAVVKSLVKGRCSESEATTFGKRIVDRNFGIVNQNFGAEPPQPKDLSFHVSEISTRTPYDKILHCAFWVLVRVCALHGN